VKSVYVIPLDADFITEVTHFIRLRTHNLSRIGIVFPGKRPALYMREKLSEYMQNPSYAPRFFSIEEFIDFIVAQHYPGWADLHYADAIWLLYTSITSLGTQKTHQFRTHHFGDFFPWGRYLLDFINQLDVESVPDGALHAVEKNADIGYDVPQHINALLKNIAAVRATFHTLLETKRSFTRGYKHFVAQQLIQSTSLSEFEHIYFAGFFALTTTEKHIIQELWSRDRADIIIQGDPEEWDILKNLTTYLGAQIEYCPCKTVMHEPAEIHSGFDIHSEVIKIYEVLQKTAQTKTAIILPSSETLIPLLTYAIDRIETPYNISLGYPLSRTSVFDLIRHVLDAQITRRNKNLYTVRSYLNVMLHPFIKNLSDETSIRALLFEIEKSLSREYAESPLSSKPLITLREIEEDQKARYSGDDRAQALTVLRKLHTLFFEGLEAAQTIRDMAQRLQDILTYIHTHTPVRSYILSGEIFNTLFELLEKIQWIEASSVRFHRKRDENIRILCDILVDYLKTATIPFATQPIEPLEIIGVLEARHMAFDTILLPDMNEGIFPRPKTVNPLVPLGVYEKLGLPSPSYNEEIFRYYFYTLIGSAKKSHLFFIDTEEKPRSRYIEQIIWDVERETENIDVVSVDRSLFRINLQVQEKEPRIIKTEKVHRLLTERTYGPTEIDDYLICPIFFYYKNILKLEEKKEVSDDIDDLERGKIIHHILRDTFSPFQGTELTASQYTRILSALHKSIERHFASRMVTGDYYLFKQLAQYKLEAYLEKHVKEIVRPFIVTHIEHTIDDRISLNGISVHFRGRMDRVDYDPSTNTYTIIDYKTGNLRGYSSRTMQTMDVTSIDDIRHSIQSLQLPIYVQLFSMVYSIPVENINGTFILLRNNEEKALYNNTGRERMVMHERYMKACSQILTHILDKNQPFAPVDDEHCSQCAYTILCHR